MAILVASLNGEFVGAAALLTSRQALASANTLSRANEGTLGSRLPVTLGAARLGCLVGAAVLVVRLAMADAYTCAADGGAGLARTPATGHRTDLDNGARTRATNGACRAAWLSRGSPVDYGCASGPATALAAHGRSPRATGACCGCSIVSAIGAGRAAVHVRGTAVGRVDLLQVGPGLCIAPGRRTAQTEERRQKTRRRYERTDGPPARPSRKTRGGETRSSGHGAVAHGDSLLRDRASGRQPAMPPTWLRKRISASVVPRFE